MLLSEEAGQIGRMNLLSQLSAASLSSSAPLSAPLASPPSSSAAPSTSESAAPANAARATALPALLGAVRRGPAVVLRLEALLLLAAALVAYHLLGGSRGTFALTFLLPDLSLLAYLAGPRAGALCYNAAHSTLAPGALALAALAAGIPGLGLAAAIWLGHIGLDRALGYGLKYQTSFASTHLGVIGGADRAQE